MERFLRWIEAALAAVSFAEEGEVETAREVLAGGGGEATRDGARDRRPSPRAPGRALPREKIARLP